MAVTEQQRVAIASALNALETAPLVDAATQLLSVLGYRSNKTLELGGTPSTFLEQFDTRRRKLRQDKALLDRWRSVNLIFQLTDDEIQAAAPQGELTFDSTNSFNARQYRSYLFFTLELQPASYTRTNLADITREVNLLFDMPAMLLIKAGTRLTLAIINRRLSKRDETRDVVRKVTLIRDISLASPHRAHVDILADLSLDSLCARFHVADFAQLHEAWGKTLNIQALNKRFFQEVRNWFYWARLHAHFPKDAPKDADTRDSESLIRLLTRLIFCWFLREKGLLSEAFFDPRQVAGLLRGWSPQDGDAKGRYYKAILQNLFFATLSTPVAQRRFRSAHSHRGRNKDYGDPAFFRHCKLFRDEAQVEELYRTVPFLNGGLFDWLDRIPGRHANTEREVRIDGFSDIKSKQPLVPDFLFFGGEQEAPELADLLGESHAPTVRGLVETFRAFKFTVEENTPLEEDIALDPELLGRVFENLLAAVNPETGTVARKSTGSFYTPREIVNYMVDEAVVRRLESMLQERLPRPPADLQDRLRELVSESAEGHRFTDAQSAVLVDAISKLKVLDPACGSGAFPVGILHRLVHVLRKLDPGNVHWKESKLSALPPEMRHKAEETFNAETFDYTRKLELIKDCIHGVDIQPTAIQISKLRFFLSLVIEQGDGRAVRPLPNLETKFVCANALLGLPRPEGWELFHNQIEAKERELLNVRSRYFFAETREEKEDCRTADAAKRREVADFIEGMGGSMAQQLASKVASWDPYSSATAAGFFDPESMFGVVDGFDITMGNPPFVRADEQSEWNQRQRRAILGSAQYETLWEKWDLYVPFIERSYKLLRPSGVTSFIVSDAFCHSKYAQKPQNWYLKHARVLRLDFCSEVQIFEAAVHNVIYFFQKAEGESNVPERRVHRETFGNVSTLPSDEQSKLTNRAFFPEDAAATFAGFR